MGAEEFFELATDFGKAPAKIAAGLYVVYKEAGTDFAKTWAESARETAGSHGKYYPDSITSETRLSRDIIVDTGPESGRKQGGMGPGFEFGSQNQPPHLDGLRALAPADAALQRVAEKTVEGLIP
jgi:hypothetical protein